MIAAFRFKLDLAKDGLRCVPVQITSLTLLHRFPQDWECPLLGEIGLGI
jgi:hypothetical protein